MRKSGSADIAAELRRAIKQGEYDHNERFPPSREMAASYGVARNTLRQALTQLEEDGYVETRPGSGTFVTYRPDTISTEAIQEANPLELIDARFALEPHICRLAVLHGRREHFEKLETLCKQMERHDITSTEFSELDSQYHLALAEATGNGLLIWVINQINMVRQQEEWVNMRHLTLDVQIIRRYNEHHRQVLNALRARAPERAANLMKHHLEAARVSLMRSATA